MRLGTPPGAHTFNMDKLAERTATHAKEGISLNAYTFKKGLVPQILWISACLCDSVDVVMYIHFNTNLLAEPHLNINLLAEPTATHAKEGISLNAHLQRSHFA